MSELQTRSLPRMTPVTGEHWYYLMADLVGLRDQTRVALGRTEYSTSPQTITAADRYVAVDTGTVAVTLNLPAVSKFSDGQILTIKDEGGNAGTNNITITPDGTEKIDGVAASVTITSNYGVVTLVAGANGNGDWWTI